MRFNDILHRQDGPVIQWPDGGKEWHVDGREVDIIVVFGYEPSVPVTEEEQMIVLRNA